MYSLYECIVDLVKKRGLAERSDGVSDLMDEFGMWKELCSFIVFNFRRRKVGGTRSLVVNHFSQSTVILFL